MVGKQSKELSEKEYDCPICLSILIEPVTMPCNHSLCMPCYMQTVEKANLTCPICRMRISVWARKSTKSKTLVDTKKWDYIQKMFPDKVSHRLEGNAASDSESEEEDLEMYLRRLKELSEPGEIRQEYEAALEKLRLQKEEEARKEEEASRALIEALQAEELTTLEATSAVMEEIEKIDHQKALEIDQEQQSQNLKPKVNLEKPSKKSLKIGNGKSPKQNKVFTPAVTLDKFFAAVPHQALSPLPLSDHDFFSQSNQRETGVSACITPGVSDFCWSRADENFDGGDDISPGPSGLAAVKKNPLVESLKANVDFKSKSYQPVVRCERNILQHLFQSKRKCAKPSTECSMKSFISKKECKILSDTILENGKDGRALSADISADDYLDDNKTTTFNRLSSPDVPVDTGLERNAELLVGSEAETEREECNILNESSDTIIYSSNNSLDTKTIAGPLLAEKGDELPLEDKAGSPPPAADSCRLEDETVTDDCLNGLLAKRKYPLVDTCVLSEISCDGLQEPCSALDRKQKKMPPKAKGKAKRSCPHRREEKNSSAKYFGKTSGEHSRSKSLLGMNTLDSFVKAVKRDAGDFEQPLGKRQKCLQPDDPGSDQEEADRLLALKLQEMYQYMEKKGLTVERFEGSAGEYSLRKKHKS